jgi:hypothetical protein
MGGVGDLTALLGARLVTRQSSVSSSLASNPPPVGKLAPLPVEKFRGHGTNGITDSAKVVDGN